MERLSVILVAALILSACQFSMDKEQPVWKTNITKAGIKNHLPAFYSGDIHTMRVLSGTKNYALKSGLLIHERFVFIESLPNTESLENPDRIITDHYSNLPPTVEIYQVENTRHETRYGNLINRSVKLISAANLALDAKIGKLVLVRDMAENEAYLAYEIAYNPTEPIYYAWATSQRKVNPVPFVPFNDPELDGAAQAHMDSLQEYRLWQASRNTAKLDTEFSTFAFSGLRDEKFIFVQHHLIGSCAAIEDNYSCLYRLTSHEWILEAEGSLPYYFLNMVDVDGDHYPELFMGNFAEEVLIEVNYKGFSILEEINWSTTECPC